MSCSCVQTNWFVLSQQISQSVLRSDPSGLDVDPSARRNADPGQVVVVTFNQAFSNTQTTSASEIACFTHSRVRKTPTTEPTIPTHPSYCAFFCLKPFRTFLLCAII
jgi:hypothetical protein